MTQPKIVKELPVNDSLKEIMSIDVQNLAEKQYAAIVKHALAILDTVRTRLKNGDLEGVKAMMRYSPAGDEMGCNNYYIDFSWGELDRDGYRIFLDLSDVCDILEDLKEKLSKKSNFVKDLISVVCGEKTIADDLTRNDSKEKPR